MADDPPKLTIAASNEGEEVTRRRSREAQERALSKLEWSIRELVANILRVMRGAGKPFRIFDDLTNLRDAMREMDEVTFYDATMRFEEVLHSAMKQERDDDGIHYACHTITRGVLQMLASELVGQGTQKRAGESELTRGIREMQSAWEESRKKWRTQAAVQSLRMKPLAPKHRKKRKAKPIPKVVAKPQQALEAQPTPAVVNAADKPASTAEFMKVRRRELGSSVEKKSKSE
jgi:hypothetical protein